MPEENGNGKIDLKTLGLATLLAGAAGVGGGTLGSNPLLGSAEDIPKEVEQQLNGINDTLDSLKRTQREQGETLKIIKCRLLDFEPEECRLMRPRNYP